MRNNDILIALSSFLLASFYYNNDVSNRVILRIGKVSITEYELEKNIDIFVADFTRQYKQKPSSTDLSKWINSFTDRTYFLADAYDKGYDTSADIVKWVYSMERYVICRQDGLLYEKMDTGQLLKERQNALLLQRRQHLMNSYIEEVKGLAQIKINPSVLSVLEDHLRHTSIRRFDTQNFSTISSSLLFSFNLDTVQHISTLRFMEYYNTLAIRKEIASKDELMFYIESFVYEQYAYRKAEKLGITKELKFLLDKNNYLNNVIWAAYEKKELRAGIIVSDDEIATRFILTKDRLTIATDAVITVYSFNDRRDAITAIMDMKAERMGPVNKSLQPIYLHKHINQKEKFLSDSIKGAVFSFKGKGVLMPLYYNGKFIVIVKEAESGRRLLPLAEVRNEIAVQIEAEKLEIRMQAYLKRLKALYQVCNEIDLKKYNYKVAEKG